MKIVLLGYRGCGKSSVGRKLANQLWKDFFDVDVLTCDRFEGLSVAQIWQQHGEPAFREAEIQVVTELMSQSDTVVALGGGTVMQEGSYQAIAQAADCKRVYLRCDPDELTRRIEADPGSASQRPSLTNSGSAADEVVSVLAQREPVYRKLADIELDVTYTTIDQAVQHLMAKL